MTGLHVIILTYNEALHIERAILHALAIPMQTTVHVVDSGSSDRTIEIATRVGATIHEHPFVNYAQQFEWAVQHVAEGADWLMRLDADEVIPEPLAVEIGAALQTAPLRTSAFEMKRQHVFWEQPIRHGGRYPLWLVRVWRPGMAHIEQRWMDEHIQVRRGQTSRLRNLFYDWNLKDLAFFTEKHNSYATREAIDVILSDAASHKRSPLSQRLNLQAQVKRLIKERLYNSLPFPVAALGYFLFRYIIQLGFLDGLPGLVYHGLQGLWYRFLVGARVRELRVLVAGESDEQEVRRILSGATGLQVS